MNSAIIDVGILWPALVAGLLVAATHVPLGIQVLNRGIVFIDLAIAQTDFVPVEAIQPAPGARVSQIEK